MNSKKLLIGLCLFMSNLLVSQTLTISSTGETGTSGTNWSVTGGTLTVSGTANISASVLQTAMLIDNLTIVPSVTSPYNLIVNINEIFTSSTSGKSLTIGATSNTGTITISQPISIDGAISIYGSKIIINNDLTTTNASSGDIRVIASNTTTPISGSGNINIATGKTLFFSTSNVTTTFDGIISGANSKLYINNSLSSSEIVLTQNNLYTGNTTINTGKLTLRNDAPNPASKSFTGSPSNLTIEPASASFTSTFSTTGYSFPSNVTIGKVNNNSDVTIDGNLSFSNPGWIKIHCNTLNLNGNISGTNGSGFAVEINCYNPLINVTGTKTISISSSLSINAPTSGFTTDLIWPISNLTSSSLHLNLGGSNNNKNVIINGPYTNTGGINITGDKIYLNSNLTSTNAYFGTYLTTNELVVSSPQTITTLNVFSLAQKSTFVSDIVFPIPNLTVSSNGLTIGTSSNTKNITIAADLSLTAANITLNGGNLFINGNLSTITSGNISLTGHTTVAPGKHIQCAGNFTKILNLKFKSDATGTAAFGTLGGTYTITSGTVTTERYIPANRAFRFISPSVTTTTSIKANWQENGGTTAGLGTHITGTGGATNGFDATALNNPSLFTFTNGAWSEVTNTNVNVLTAGSPYRLMVRGDRTTDLTTNNPTETATILRETGVLKTGNFTPTLNQTANGFSLIGNPYQAPIDIKAILTASSNMDSNVVYYWDPTLNTRGGYVTRNLTSNANDVTSSFNQYVQPGQAVFVKKDNTANVPTMTITEANKSVANIAAGVFRNTSTSDFGLLRVNLQTNLNNQWQTIEGALALFNDAFSWNVNSEDATKMNNLDEEVSFTQNNTSLAIACQNNPITTSELPIKIDKMSHTNYQWQFDLDNYNGATPYLFDSVNNSYTQINNGTIAPFTVATNTTNRFKIVFQNNALSVTDFNSTISLYPNPTKANESFFIQGGNEATIEVYNLLGQIIPVQTKNIGNTLQVTPKTNINKGIYLVNVFQNGKTKQIKWIVE